MTTDIPEPDPTQGASSFCLLRPTPQRRIEISVEQIPDNSIGGGVLSTDSVLLTDRSDTSRNVHIRIGIDGRLRSISLSGFNTTDEVPLLERSFDGTCYIYFENCRNLEVDHEGVYYYYDYYQEKIAKDDRVAESLINEIQGLLESILVSLSSHGTGLERDSSVAGPIRCENAENVKSVLMILEKAVTRYNWRGLADTKAEFGRTYLSSLDVIPPDVRPDKNPIFAVIQITAGCRRKANLTTSCGFCGAYRNVRYYERDIDELTDHIECVRNLFGRDAWKSVRKLFLADADPLNTRIESTRYMDVLAATLPDAVWYEAFVSTATILAKPIDIWRQLGSKGLRRLYWGVESADCDTLEVLRKPHSTADLYAAARGLAGAEVPYSAVVMSGIPIRQACRKQMRGDSHADMTARFIEEVGCKSVYISRFVPQPGTACYGKICAGTVGMPTKDEAEAQHRRMVRSIGEVAEVRGSYGVQFVG